MNKKIALLLLLLLSNLVLAQWPHENISHATFAKSVENRTPIEPITKADNDLSKLYFFTNIRNLTGGRITHRWVYTPKGTNENKVKAEIGFDIKDKRWRVWSSKNLWYKWIGTWRVEVIDAQGNILLTKKFSYKDKHE